MRPKIVASTATVRRAEKQIRSLFDRERTAIFPPPGITRSDSFFAQTVPSSREARLYLGVASQGRGPKLLFLRALQTLLVQLAGARLMRSAHDCSDGGLAVTLAECTFDTDGIGADVSIDAVSVARNGETNRAAALFGESASRAVISVAQSDVADVLKRASAAAVPAKVIGRTGGDSIRISVGGEAAVTLAVAEAERAWSNAVEQYFAKRVA